MPIVRLSLFLSVTVCVYMAFYGPLLSHFRWWAVTAGRVASPLWSAATPPPPTKPPGSTGGRAPPSSTRWAPGCCSATWPPSASAFSFHLCLCRGHTLSTPYPSLHAPVRYTIHWFRFKSFPNGFVMLCWCQSRQMSLVLCSALLVKPTGCISASGPE